MKSQKNRHETIDQKKTDEFVSKLYKAIEGGATLKDIKGIPDSFMKGIYSYAYEFYNQGRLDDAEVFFRFLAIFDFYNPDYLMGLAAVYQLKKRYEKALELYALADALNKGEKNYKPVFYAGQCNIMLKKPEQAIQCFEIVIDYSSDSELKKKAAAYLETLKKRQPAKTTPGA